MELNCRRTVNVRLERVAPDLVTDELMALINTRAIVELKPEDIVVRSALVCNDQPDSYLTQFTKGALRQVAEQIVGMKVMRNHNTWASEDLPVASWIQAGVVRAPFEKSPDGKASFVRAIYYMSRLGDVHGLAARIDAGIIDEVSLSWYPVAFECSVCGKDPYGIDCQHAMGKEYGGKVAYALMPGVRSVIEASLVWKGGQYGTTIDLPGRTAEKFDTMETLMARAAQKFDPEKREARSDLDELFREFPEAADDLDELFESREARDPEDSIESLFQ